MSDFKIEWFEKYCPYKPEVIMDIGTYNGTEARDFKEKYPSARVFAIEASKKNYNRMSTILKKKLEGIKIFNLAIGDKDGIVSFYDTKERLTGAGSILKPKESLIKGYAGTEVVGEMVECIRLDSFCKKENIEKIDLIHMDIQGAEYLALCGIGNLRPKMIFLEMGGATINYYEGAINPENKLLELGYIRLKKLNGDQLWIYNENN